MLIFDGEDSTLFRNASKELYRFLAAFIWSGRCERLGFDEIWLDCTDMIDYNMSILNLSNLKKCFFQLDKLNPCAGFEFDATVLSGHSFPAQEAIDYAQQGSNGAKPDGVQILELRLRLASHLAGHLRSRLEQEKGYTATCGISVNKLLSKLVGNLHKPNSHTTLLPPYNSNSSEQECNVNFFLDSHDIGKIPGVGFKVSQKLREYILDRPAAFHDGLVYGRSKESVSVGDVRKHPQTSPEALNKVLGGAGWPKDIGYKVLDLLNGRDDSEVNFTKQVPTQISIEDSYLRLDTIEEVEKEFFKLSNSLVKRMRLDLVDAEQDDQAIPADEFHNQDRGQFRLPNKDFLGIRWLAIPRTLRLSTRPRPPKNADDTQPRTFNRISRSCALPSFALSNQPVETIASRLVRDTLIPLFTKLHPEKNGWNLSLINLAVISMQTMAGDTRISEGRDISRMFRQQEGESTKIIVQQRGPPNGTTAQNYQDGLVDAKHTMQGHVAEESNVDTTENAQGSEDHLVWTQESSQLDDPWDNEYEALHPGESCSLCGASMPRFALEAHYRFHLSPD